MRYNCSEGVVIRCKFIHPSEEEEGVIHVSCPSVMAMKGFIPSCLFECSDRKFIWAKCKNWKERQGYDQGRTSSE